MHRHACGIATVRSRKGILSAKKGIGKYYMWYGVVCKAVMSSFMSSGSSLAGVATRKDTTSCILGRRSGITPMADDN